MKSGENFNYKQAVPEKTGEITLTLPQMLLNQLQFQENWQELAAEAIAIKLSTISLEKTLLKAGTDFRAIVEAIPMPVIISQFSGGKILYGNQAARETLKLSSEALSHLPLVDLCADPAAGEKLLSTITAEKFVHNYQMQWCSGEKKLLWMNVAAQTLNFPGETVIITASCNIGYCKDIEQTLAEKEAFLQLVLDNIPQLIFWKDCNSIFVGCNRLWAGAAGLNHPHEATGKTDAEIYQLPVNRHQHPPMETLAYYKQQDQRIISTGKPELHFVEHKQNAQGEEVWYDTNKIPIKDPQGNIVGILGTIENITERKLIERALQREKELAQVTLQSIGEGVITTDAAGKIRECNSMAEQLTGWSQEEMKGRALGEVFRLVDENSRQTLENPVEKVLQSGYTLRLKNSPLLLAQDEREYAINLTVSPIGTGEEEWMGAVLVFSDQTQSRRLAKQISWQASHDALTGLLNRKAFEERLQEALESAKGQNLAHVLCYLDLDRFKIINDTCGHLAGDELLRQLSAQIQQRIRATDTLARLGGDEFALLLYQCPLQEGQKIAEEIRCLIADFQFIWQQHHFTVGVSIGIIRIDQYSLDQASLLSEVDMACYTAKNRGRNQIHVYEKTNLELNNGT